MCTLFSHPSEQQLRKYMIVKLQFARLDEKCIIRAALETIYMFTVAAAVSLLLLLFYIISLNCNKLYI